MCSKYSQRMIMTEESKKDSADSDAQKLEIFNRAFQLNALQKYSPTWYALLSPLY